MRRARKFVRNLAEYKDALIHSEPGQTTDVHTKDGLRFTIRKNCMDAGILAEVFLDRNYASGFDLTANPVVVDIGGYIGDFAIYAARYLKARRVIVAEPSPSNWNLLTKNIADNNYADRITALNVAVTDGKPIMMNVDAPERSQARVSAFYGSGQVKEVRGISLKELLEAHNLQRVDLLKIDCEGGEYLILRSTPDEVLARFQNIVFEFHEIDGFAAQLSAVKGRLSDLGFGVRQKGHLVSAMRPFTEPRQLARATSHEKGKIA